jgi:pectate lyase
VASDSKPTKDASDWTTTATFPVGIPYSYTPDPAACIKAKLPAAAGAGTQLAKITCP